MRRLSLSQTLCNAPKLSRFNSPLDEIISEIFFLYHPTDLRHLHLKQQPHT